MHWKKRLVLFVFAASYSLLLNAQDSAFLSLSEIMERIEIAYPEIQMYDAKIKSINARVEGARSWMPPVASFGLDRFPYRLSNLRMKDDPMNQAGFMLSVEQMIPNTAKLKAKENYLFSLSYIQQSNAEWRKNSLRSHAKILYYQRYIAEKKINVLKENAELLNVFIEVAEERYKYNQADLTTIYKAKAKLSELENMQRMLRSYIAESNIGLNSLMNRDINTHFDIDTGISVHNYEMSLEDTITLIRNDLVSIENAIKSMQLNREWMASAKKPDFGVRVQHMQMLGMPSQFTLMGMITIPMVSWSSKMYKSEIKSMNFEIEAMNNEKETMRLMALWMVREKLAMLKFEKKQLMTFESEIIPLYKRNFEINLLAYKQTTGSLFVLLDAWDMLLMKQIEYYDKYFIVLRLEAEYEYEIEKR